MKILGIETSCDDTGISIYESNYGIIFNKKISQIHSKYGGIVPEIASLKHIKNIKKIIKELLNKFNINNIDNIAYTAGPGLFSSLIVGSTIASSLAYSLNIKSIPINHLEGHILSSFIKNNDIKFPFLSLLISGGNTQFIYAYDLGKYKIIGKTLDDPVGETFDKVAKLLGIKYPGASKLSHLSNFGIKNIYKFPKPLINSLDFSFSGLKTYIKNLVNNKKNKINIQDKCNIALEFENTIIDIIYYKCKLAIKKTNLKLLTVSGGVISNKKIRNSIYNLKNELNIKVLFPDLELSTDNGAMIAYAGFLHLINKKININKKLNIFVDNKWSLENIFKIY